MWQIRYIILFSFVFNYSWAQIAHYNQYPTMHVDTYLDDCITSDISFAYSMRRLYNDHTGPIIKLRRNSDNTTMDFFTGDDDKISFDEINIWAGSSTIFVDTWYDQSGQNRNAVQAILNAQPQFSNNANLPFFFGDGSNDFLQVENGGLQVVTNNGGEGTVFVILRPTNRNQDSFGVKNGNNRWSSHANWGNGSIFFDFGDCCNAIRSFTNNVTTSFNQYTLLRGANNILGRRNGVERANGNYTLDDCTLAQNFTICVAKPANSFSTTRFSELILYKTGVPEGLYQAIEQNQLIFWGL